MYLISLCVCTDAQELMGTQLLRLSGSTRAGPPARSVSPSSPRAPQFSVAVPQQSGPCSSSALLLADAGGSASMTATGLVQGSGCAAGAVGLDVLAARRDVRRSGRAVSHQHPERLSLADPSVSVRWPRRRTGFAYINTQPAVGLTITANTQLTGSLLQTLQARLAGFPSNSQVQLSAFVPVFSMSNVVSQTVITLNLPSFAFNSQVAWNGFVVTLYPLVADLSATGSVQLSLQSQPSSPLVFAVTGDLQINAAAGAQVTLTGSMQGSWQNAFGVSGLALSNVVVSATIANGVPSFGLGAAVQVGTVQASFNGDDVGAGEVGVQASVSHLALSDLIGFYNNVAQPSPAAERCPSPNLSSR